MCSERCVPLETLVRAILVRCAQGLDRSLRGTDQHDPQRSPELNAGCAAAEPCLRETAHCAEPSEGVRAAAGCNRGKRPAALGARRLGGGALSWSGSGDHEGEMK